MVSALKATSFGITETSANVLEREKPSLFMLEHQFRVLFFELQGRYENTLFQLENSNHPCNIPISSEELSGLFKIVSEAIGNSLKHSHAKTIKAEVKLINHRLIQLSVSDNGSGFDLNKVAETKKLSGIKRICDCAHRINARVVFDSKPDSGTLVVIAKPVEKQKARFYTRLIALF